MLAAVLVSVGLLAVGVGLHRLPPRAYVATCLVGTPVLLGIGRWLGLSWSDLGLGAGTWWRGAVWAGAGVLAVAVLAAAGTALPRVRGLLADESASARGGRDLAYDLGVRLPLGTVLFEEVAFRGLLLGVYLAVTGPVPAVVASSMVFGLWHVAPSWGRAVDLPGTGVLGRHANLGFVVGSIAATSLAGAGFAVLRLASGSLLPAIAVHWALNAGGTLIAVMHARRGGARPAAGAGFD